MKLNVPFRVNISNSKLHFAVICTQVYLQLQSQGGRGALYSWVSTTADVVLIYFTIHFSRQTCGKDHPECYRIIRKRNRIQTCHGSSQKSRS